MVRYGNVMGSNGSVMPFFLNKRKDGYLPITNPKMTRFNISLDEGVDMVLHALETAWGGELFVPKIPSYRLLDIAKAIAPEIEHRIVGIRPGEKIHEEMITASDSYVTYDLGKYYTILPTVPVWNLDEFVKAFSAEKVPNGYSYTSGNNGKFLSVLELRELILDNLDPNFDPVKF